MILPKKITKLEFMLIVILLLANLLVLFVNIRINLFRYNNFDMGKFDLGNMTQMVWNVTQGRGLMLTDYFGTNLPRWAMSHVDPILYVFVPIFAIFPHPLTLVFSQLVLVIFSSFLIYLIARLVSKNILVAFLLALSYLLYPAVGYLTAWTGFHGVTAVIPFFLGAFYLFERMWVEQVFTKKGLVFFVILLILTMMGKEQLPLYVFLYSLFIYFFRNTATNIKDSYKTPQGKLALFLMAFSFLWFVFAFFILIPANAHYRIKGYERFVESIGGIGTQARDVSLENYFLSRYDDFGDSYGEVIIGMVTNPQKVVSVFFSGDNPDNFNKTFLPVLFLPFVYPLIFMFAVPDLLINYLTTAGGIGTAEISNHRISMIVPVLFLATIYAIHYISSKTRKQKNKVAVILSFLVLLSNLINSYRFNNPAYLWFTQAVHKKFVSKVLAKSEPNLIKKDLKIGEVVRLSPLEDKDRECAQKVVEHIPAGVSVSGPDSLGSHLAQRETYAIFPALHNEADYVIVDVFARKILSILDIDIEMVRGIVERMIKNKNYDFEFGCGNYFIFKKVGYHEKSEVLPMQQRNAYEEKMHYDFFQGVSLVDYSYEKQIKKGKHYFLDAVYFRSAEAVSKDTSLEGYLMFLTFVNKKTGEIYQQANLPSYAFYRPEEWEKHKYYTEEIEFVIPDFVERGEYMLLIGMDNKIRTRSIYLGDVFVED